MPVLVAGETNFKKSFFHSGSPRVSCSVCSPGQMTEEMIRGLLLMNEEIFVLKKKKNVSIELRAKSGEKE